MALFIYKYNEDNSEFIEISKNGAGTSPIQTTHNGTDGQVVEEKLYLKNDDQSLFFTNVELSATPPKMVRVGDINYPEAFINYKIIIQDEQPTESEWLAVESGNKVNFETIGTNQAADLSYKPFWIQVGIAPGTRVQTIDGVSLYLSAEANTIGG